MDAGFRTNLSEQSEETIDTQNINNNMKDRMNEVEDSEVDIKVSDETTTRNSETQQTENTIPTSQAGMLNPFPCQTNNLRETLNPKIKLDCLSWCISVSCRSRD